MTKKSRDKDIEYLLAKSKIIKGLDLERLGAVPDPALMTEDQKADYDPEYLEELAGLSDDERARRLHQARLIAGIIAMASVTMIDHLFDDLETISELDEITAAAIEETWVLHRLPPRFAHKYDPGFIRKFVVVTADLTGALARTWREPDCVAAELALKCLLDEAEAIEGLYQLDLPVWRNDLEDQLVQDFDYDLLYDMSLDGFEDDSELLKEQGIVPMRFEHWFKPFNEAYSVPPFAQD